MLEKLAIQVTAETLVADGKGILAADESFGSIQRRFDTVTVPSTPENRRAYREIFLTTPGVEDYVSGVILFDETLRQESEDGTPFPEVLNHKGIIPGIKVDKGAKPLAGFPYEKITEGLDGLRERLMEYRALGARFAKWRAVFSITPGTPTPYGITANAHVLARYAILCQEEGLTPIVEPEVLMDGVHHISVCEEVTTSVLNCVFEELYDARVMLEAILLKPNMIMPGVDFPKPPTPEEVAVATIRTLRRSVPSAVPGIVFLSGGQSPEMATANLNAMNAMGPHPWTLSFSFGRALQGPSLQAWHGEANNVSEAQRLFYHRARLNSAAVRGEYMPRMETETA